MSRLGRPGGYALILALAGLLVTAGVVARAEDRPTTPEVGKLAPELTKVARWVNTEGKELTLKGLEGKVVLLDFWAVW